MRCNESPLKVRLVAKSKRKRTYNTSTSAKIVTIYKERAAPFKSPKRFKAAALMSTLCENNESFDQDHECSKDQFYDPISLACEEKNDAFVTDTSVAPPFCYAHHNLQGMVNANLSLRYPHNQIPMTARDLKELRPGEPFTYFFDGADMINGADPEFFVSAPMQFLVWFETGRPETMNYEKQVETLEKDVLMLVYKSTVSGRRLNVKRNAVVGNNWVSGNNWDKKREAEAPMLLREQLGSYAGSFVQSFVPSTQSIYVINIIDGHKTMHLHVSDKSNMSRYLNSQHYFDTLGMDNYETVFYTVTESMDNSLADELRRATLRHGGVGTVPSPLFYKACKFILDVQLDLSQHDYFYNNMELDQVLVNFDGDSHEKDDLSKYTFKMTNLANIASFGSQRWIKPKKLNTKKAIKAKLVFQMGDLIETMIKAQIPEDMTEGVERHVLGVPKRLDWWLDRAEQGNERASLESLALILNEIDTVAQLQAFNLGI